MLYWMVLITTRMSSPPRDSCVTALSVYHATCCDLKPFIT